MSHRGQETANATAIGFSPDSPCIGVNLTNPDEIIIYPSESCPPLPPLPLPPPPALPIHINGRGGGGLHTSILLSVSIIFGLLVIVLTSFAALRRRRRRLRVSAPPPALPPAPPPRFGAAAAVAPPAAPHNVDSLEASLIEEQPGDYHVWNIKTRGLDAAAIETIPLFRYNPAASPVDASDCAVCLGEFAGGDTLRLLPKCEHAFHISCIDTWLASHLNCPICRAPVAVTKSNSIAPSASSSSFVLPIASNPVPVPPLMSIELQQAASMALREEEEANSSGMENGDGAAITVSPSPGPSSPGRFPGGLVENGLQPINRSRSMDAVAMDAVFLRVEDREGFDVDRKEASFCEESPRIDLAKRGNERRMFSVLPKVLMSRSLSSSGRWFSFTKRGGRVAHSSVLPI